VNVSVERALMNVNSKVIDVDGAFIFVGLMFFNDCL
jgi:hypothetical protein